MLSQAEGLVTHVLRTRAPLSTPKGFSFDLHVLSPPQTLALSQDQTLQFEFLLLSLSYYESTPLRVDDSLDEVATRYRVDFSHVRGNSWPSLTRLPAVYAILLLLSSFQKTNRGVGSKRVPGVAAPRSKRCPSKGVAVYS